MLGRLYPRLTCVRDDLHHLHSAHHFQHHQDYHESATSHVLSSKLDGESLVVISPCLPIPSTRLGTQLVSSDFLKQLINSGEINERERLYFDKDAFKRPVVYSLCLKRNKWKAKTFLVRHILPKKEGHEHFCHSS